MLRLIAFILLLLTPFFVSEAEAPQLAVGTVYEAPSEALAASAGPAVQYMVMRNEGGYRICPDDSVGG